MNIIFLSETTEDLMIDYMRTRGTVILVPKDLRFDSRISSHPDLIISVLDNNLIIDEKADQTIFKQLDALNVPYIPVNSKLSCVYPGDTAYNAVITRDCLIHNVDYTNPLILTHAKNSGKRILPVKQGYAKCSTVIVDDNHLITADLGIYHATKDYLKVLLVQPGHVRLEGFEYGFLGGASASFKDAVIFYGDLSKHPDFDEIEAFIHQTHKQLVYFKEFPLTDIGSVLVYQYQEKTRKVNLRRKHVNIPIFISHEGCPNDCVFCNQRKITSKPKPMTLDEIEDQVKQYSSTFDESTEVELAFFGGSFTGIDTQLQESYLNLAASYKKSGKINAIRLSTRPDYISAEILDRLKYYGVDIIELGVQSLIDEVLLASNRGHTVTDVYRSVELIKAYGFRLGLQIMAGLPTDTKERSVLTSKLIALLGPEFVRIYPTLVIKETALSQLSQTGKYHPLSLDEGVDWTKEMYQVLLKMQIPVIRIGLQPTDLIAEGMEVVSGPFHPAFRQLVESAYFLDQMKQMLPSVNPMEDYSEEIQILCHPKDLSQVIGHNRRNISILKKDYPHIKIISDPRIKPMSIELHHITSI